VLTLARNEIRVITRFDAAVLARFGFPAVIPG